MGRPTVKTRELLLDDVNQMKELFGTIPNAYDRLCLIQHDVPLSEFKRAMAWRPIKPEHADVISMQWEKWKAEFLLVPTTLTFTLQK